MFPIVMPPIPMSRIRPQSWKRCVAASIAGVPTARRNGSVALQNILVWNLPIVRPAARESAIARRWWSNDVGCLLFILPISDLSRFPLPAIPRLEESAV